MFAHLTAGASLVRLACRPCAARVRLDWEDVPVTLSGAELAVIVRRVGLENARPVSAAPRWPVWQLVAGPLPPFTQGSETQKPALSRFLGAIARPVLEQIGTARQVPSIR